MTSPMRPDIERLDDTNARLYRVARRAKRLMACGPFFDAGLLLDLPSDHDELALACAFLARSTGSEHAEIATLHQMEPEALRAAAPGIVAAAWRRLSAAGPPPRPIGTAA